MRTSYAAGIAIVSTILQTQATFLQQEEAWPPVLLPMNFQLEGAYFTFNEETQKLEPYYDVKVAQYIDSDGNREKIVINQNIQGIGYTNITNFIDCTTGVITQHIPIIAYCKSVPMGQIYNITDLFNKIRDPSSGVSTYEGLATLPWSNGTNLYHFTMKTLDGQGKTIKQDVYYDTSSLNLKYAMIEGAPEILVTDIGYVERTFTDEDFKGLDTCTSEIQMAHDSPYEMTPLKGLRL